MPGSLYEKLGGASEISRLVLSFYEKVVEDAQIKHFFANADMQHLVDHQVKYVSSILGGPLSSSDEELLRVHRNANISDSDFDVMMDLFNQTLVEGGLSSDDVQLVCEKMYDKRSLIVV